MGDFVNKVVSVIIVAFMCLTVVLMAYTSSDMKEQRLVFNEISFFIDKVTDKGSIEESDINQLYLDLNAYSMILDVKVKRLIRGAVRVPDENGVFVTKTTYFSVDDLTEMNSGDVVQVQVSEIGVSTARRLLYQVLKIDNGAFEITQARAVK